MPRSELIISTKIIYIIYDIIYIYISKNTCTHFYFICNTLMTAGMTSQLTSLSTGFLPWAGGQVEAPHKSTTQSASPRNACSKCAQGTATTWCNESLHRCITKPAGFSVSWMCLLLWTSCKSRKAFIHPSNQCLLPPPKKKRGPAQNLRWTRRESGGLNGRHHVLHSWDSPQEGLEKVWTCPNWIYILPGSLT